jgi:predicted Zn-dependent protease
MGIRRFFGLKTDEERKEEVATINKELEKHRSILESPAFQKVIRERFGGVINARNLRLANTPELMQAILDEQTAEYELRMARAKATADAKLLRAAEAAVEAKAEAEANPDDPLSWLRMAEAMDAANRHEEAERCRKTAMELMEK